MLYMKTRPLIWTSAKSAHYTKIWAYIPTGVYVTSVGKICYHYIRWYILVVITVDKMFHWRQSFMWSICDTNHVMLYACVTNMGVICQDKGWANWHYLPGITDFMSNFGRDKDCVVPCWIKCLIQNVNVISMNNSQHKYHN